MNRCATPGNGYGKIPDTSKHVSYSFRCISVMHNLCKAHFFNPVSLCKHHFTGIKKIGIPVLVVLDFSSFTPENMCFRGPRHILKGFDPEHTPGMTEAHDLIYFLRTGFFTVDDGDIPDHEKTFSLVADFWGEFPVTRVFISDRYPGNIPLSVRPPRVVDPGLARDLYEFVF